jgi:hypothetical protein
MEGDTFRNPPSGQEGEELGVTVHVDHAMLMAIVSSPRVDRTPLRHHRHELALEPAGDTGTAAQA